MTEALIPALEQKRFIIKPESMSGLKILRRNFEELQTQYPHLSGLGFFGSRTKGTDHETSDYDICVFYNSDRMNSGLLYREEEDYREEEWGRITDALSRDLVGSLDIRVKGVDSSLRINISTKRTDRQLEWFVQAATPFIHQDDFDESVILTIRFQTADDLYKRLYLAFGDEVYKNRAYILHQLGILPNGSKYIQLLMKSLAYFERDSEYKIGTPNYLGYPQDLDMANEYFITQANEYSANKSKKLYRHDLLNNDQLTSPPYRLKKLIRSIFLFSSNQKR